MRIACPRCEAAYEVPDALIGTGRQLRCAKCGHDWLAAGVPAVAAPMVPPQPPVPSPPSRVVENPTVPLPTRHRPPQLIDPPLPPARRASGLATAALWAAWIGSGLLLGALGTGAWVYRGPIAEAWPPAARLYQLLGAVQDG